MIWLIVLIFVVVIVVFVMHFRRQSRAREAASAERMKAFLDQARAGASGNNGAASGANASASAQTAPAPVAARDAKPPIVQTPSGIRLRAPVLSAEQRAAYQLLRSALVGQEILAQVSLAAIVAPSEDVTGFAREAAQRRMADTLLDFVVCDAAHKPLAVLQCGPRAGKAVQEAVYAQSCVVSLGLRWIELDPSSLPPADALRQRVLGT